MKIKFGKFILNSDRLNWWINEEYEIEKGKNKGKTELRNVTGWCNSFEKCRNSFIERRIGENGATALLEVLDSLNSLFEDLKALDEVKFKADSEKLKEMSK